MMEHANQVFRDLMDSYCKRYTELQVAEKEAEESGNPEYMAVVEGLQSQCRQMITQLFNAMEKAGMLDKEEIEFGALKKRGI